jgi:polysaccharide export outer membrane protein
MFNTKNSAGAVDFLVVGALTFLVSSAIAIAAEVPSAVPAAQKPEKPTPALYRLGPGDEIKVFQPNAEEFDEKTARINDQGIVNLPLVGRLQVGGLTIEEAESLLAKSLAQLLVHPQPVISITEYRSEPVSVLGEVNTPGVIQLQGKKTLVEVLSLAGGLKQDAGTDVQVTRRLIYGKLPLPGAVNDPQDEYSIARLNLTRLLRGDNPSDNIQVFPQDIISVPKGEEVYVVGSVKKPGGFPLSANGGVSILQAVALAEGLGPTAGTSQARIYRSNGDGQPKTEIAVDLKAIMAGKSTDITLMPKDVLFVPESTSKVVRSKAAALALSAATGLAWRF